MNAALTAMVPGSMILIASATLLADTFFRYFQSHASDASISRAAKLLVPVVALIAVIFTLRGGTTIVALLLMGYGFVTQILPALVASLLPHNPRKAPSPASARESPPSLRPT
jgi:SSS family solute:Na+ symporter